MIDLHTLSTGVIPAADNYALLRLSALLGDSLIFGSNATASGPVKETLLVNLSAVLSPVYLAVLLLILAYIGIGGTAKTAIDGEFLGRDWHSFMVPASIMLSVMMLSPVPSQSGITFAQVIFMRAVVYGSNFADLILKSAVEEQSAIAFRHGQGATGFDPNFPAKSKYVLLMEQTSSRMKEYLPVMLCAESEIAMGEGKSMSFFVGLNSICKVPAGAVEMYTPFFNATINKSLDPNKPDYVKVDPHQKRGTDESTNEYACYYNAFKDTYLQESGIPGTFKEGLLPPIPAIQVPWAAASVAGAPAAVLASSMTSVRIHKELMRVGWPIAVTAAAKCIEGIIPPSQGFLNRWSSALSTSTTVDTQWGHGWSDAAGLTKDNFNDADAVSSTPLSFKKADIAQPEVTRIPADSPRYVQIASLINVTNDVTPDLQKLMDALRAEELRTNTNTSGSTVSPGYHNYTDARKIAVVSASMGMALYQTSAAGFADANGVAANYARIAVGNGDAERRGIQFFQNMKTLGGPLGPTSAKMNYGLGVGLRAVSSFANSAWAALGIKMAAEKALDSIPFGGAGAGVIKGLLKLGGKVAGKVGGAVGAVMGMPGVSTALLISILTINVMTLAPEITMALALVLWIVRVTAWFMVIPISALVIAIPNTRVGHSAWKEGLALALTPVITILFYIVSLMVQDVIIDVAGIAMFGKYMDHGGLATTVNLFIDLFSGEALYRLVGFLTLLGAGFFFTVMLVLRGPGWAFSKMGLSSNDAFEGEMREMEGGISGKSGVSQKIGNL